MIYLHDTLSCINVSRKFVLGKYERNYIVYERFVDYCQDLSYRISQRLHMPIVLFVEIGIGWHKGLVGEQLPVLTRNVSWALASTNVTRLFFKLRASHINIVEKQFSKVPPFGFYSILKSVSSFRHILYLSRSIKEVKRHARRKKI